MRTLPLLLFSAAMARGGCIPVAGDRILGLDMALANPQFAALPPAMTIGYAPAPGAQRVFAIAELERIARANRITLVDPAEVCFEIPMHAILADAMRDAMLSALPADSELKIVELPKTNIPAGPIEFALIGLEPALPLSKGSRVWRGSVRYGQTLRMPIWARVTVERKHLAVVAGRELPLNTVIDQSSLRVETVSVPIDSERVAERIEDVLGRVPKKAIHAGDTIPLAILNMPPVVHRGEAVKVEVHSGRATVVFDAVAQNAAGRGEMVQLKNPDSGQIFRARMEDRGRALVIVPTRDTL